MSASAQVGVDPRDAQTQNLQGSFSEAHLDRLVRSRARERVKLGPGVSVPGTRYRITGWLGDGGTGVVYEAEHEDLGRRVAIKVLHIEHSEDPEMLKTFRDEARAATKIGSPYIVEVIDFAGLPDGRLLYVMERLRGVALDKHRDQAPMTMSRFIGIYRQACKGLAAAHEVGLVHRDIKPEHLLVLDPGEPQAAGRTDKIKIMDFGIAAVLGQAADIQGTPSYMAPEQVLGVGVARQNDIYSLGCSMYEMFAGHPPFVGESLKDVLRMHLREPPKPLTELVGTEVIHPALDAVIQKCLAKKRVERFSDMVELELALVEAQVEAGVITLWDDLPMPRANAETHERLEAGLAALRREVEPAKRSWFVPAVLGALLASAAVGAIAYVLRPPPPVEVADTSRVDELTAEAKGAAARAAYVYPPEQGGKTAFLWVLDLESLDGDEAKLGQERASQLRNEFADTLERLGDEYWAVEHGRPFAIDYYAQALVFDPTRTKAIERGGLTPGERSELRRKANENDFSSAEIDAAAPLAVLATDDEAKRKARMKKWVRKDPDKGSLLRDDRFERLLRNLGEVEFPEPATAQSATPKVIAAVPANADAQTEDGEDEAEADEPTTKRTRRDPKRSRALAKQGRVALRSGRFDRASELFHQALELDNRNAQALIGLSDVSFERADYPKAVSYARRAVGVAPRAASFRVKYGDTLFKILKYGEAREQYEKAISLGSRVAKKQLAKLDAKTGR